VVGHKVQCPAHGVDRCVDDDEVTKQRDEHRPDRKPVALRLAQQPDSAKKQGQPEDAKGRGADQEAARDEPLVGLPLGQPRLVHVFVKPAAGHTERGQIQGLLLPAGRQGLRGGN
jgi:hypothetical protein